MLCTKHILNTYFLQIGSCHKIISFKLKYYTTNENVGRVKAKTFNITTSLKSRLSRGKSPLKFKPMIKSHLNNIPIFSKKKKKIRNFPT